jgi:predicted metal-dependent hydrolase
MAGAETFLFSKWPVELHRKAFRRSMSIYLYPNKPIKVVANHTLAKKEVIDFLLKKQEWIEKTFEKFSEHLEQFPEKKIKAYEVFPFLGIDRKLKVVITPNKKFFVSVSEQDLLLHVPRNEWSANAKIQEYPGALKEIRHFYKREAETLLLSRVKLWSEQMGLRPSQVKFREQRTRWGSCSSRRVINLNWRLIVFPLSVIDYVIVHELAHIEQMNHSAKFWAIVEKHIPDFKVPMKVLKESHHQTEFLSLKD